MSTDPSLVQLKNAIFLDTAEDRDLTRIGYNFGIPRLKYSPNDDSVYRELIPKCGLSEKVIIKRIVEFLTVFLGEKYPSVLNSYATSVTAATSSALPVLTDTSLSLASDVYNGYRLVDAKDQEWVIVKTQSNNFSLRYRSPSTSTPPTSPSLGSYKVTKPKVNWEVCDTRPGEITVEVFDKLKAKDARGATYLQYGGLTYIDSLASTIQELATTATVNTNLTGVVVSGMVNSGLSLTEYNRHGFSSLSIGVSPGGGTLSLAAGEGGFFPETPLSPLPQYEIILTEVTTGATENATVVTRSGDTLTLLAGVTGGFSLGSSVELKVTSSSMSNELKPSSIAGDPTIAFTTTPAHHKTFVGSSFYSFLTQTSYVAGTGTTTPLGDFFTTKSIVSTLSVDAVAGANSATLSSMTGLPNEGFFTFVNGATREEYYCERSGSTLAIQNVLTPAVSSIPTTFVSTFPAATTKVYYYDLPASVNEPSSKTANNNCPILLGGSGGALKTHLEEYMSFIKAAGVSFKIIFRTL